MHTSVYLSSIFDRCMCICIREGCIPSAISRSVLSHKERKYLPVRNAILSFLFICIKISLWHVTQREKRDKKKQSNELVLSNRSSPIYPDKARASYLYIILHKFLNSLKTSLMKRNGKWKWKRFNVSFLVDPNYPNNTYSVDNVEAFDG